MKIVRKKTEQIWGLVLEKSGFLYGALYRDELDLLGGIDDGVTVTAVKGTFYPWLLNTYF